jgi:hypothetical protein
MFVSHACQLTIMYALLMGNVSKTVNLSFVGNYNLNLVIAFPTKILELSNKEYIASKKLVPLLCAIYLIVIEKYIKSRKQIIPVSLLGFVPNVVFQLCMAAMIDFFDKDDLLLKSFKHYTRPLHI